MPNTGKLVNTSGNNAQCTAQATETVTPKKSTFILENRRNKKLIFVTLLHAKIQGIITAAKKITATKNATGLTVARGFPI
jgi:hypothetical protein